MSGEWGQGTSVHAQHVYYCGEGNNHSHGERTSNLSKQGICVTEKFEQLTRFKTRKHISVKTWADTKTKTKAHAVHWKTVIQSNRTGNLSYLLAVSTLNTSHQCLWLATLWKCSTLIILSSFPRIIIFLKFTVILVKHIQLQDMLNAY